MNQYLIGLMACVVCFLLLSCGAGLNAEDQLMDNSFIPRKLNPCPPSPNCHCSEDKTAKGWLAPLFIEGDVDQAWARVSGLVEALGGEMIYHNDEYLHAVFTSLIFRFKDDLELRLDFENRLIHVRSASRVGHSDFGVNRRRIERLRSRFEAASMM